MLSVPDLNPVEPPDLVPVLASTLTILALLIVGAILAALIIRRVFYTRTTKRWDDDYVMMNTKVLTVPLFDPMNAGAFEEEQEDGQDTVAARTGTAASDTRSRRQIQDRSTYFFTRHTTHTGNMLQ